jgi:hypothetical protein
MLVSPWPCPAPPTPPKPQALKAVYRVSCIHSHHVTWFLLTPDAAMTLPSLPRPTGPEEG